MGKAYRATQFNGYKLSPEELAALKAINRDRMFAGEGLLTVKQFYTMIERGL